MKLILFVFLFFGGFAVNAQINSELLSAIQANDLVAVKAIAPTPSMLNAQDKNDLSVHDRFFIKNGYRIKKASRMLFGRRRLLSEKNTPTPIFGHLSSW